MTSQEKAEQFAGKAPPLNQAERDAINALFPAYIFRRSCTDEIWTTCCRKHMVVQDEDMMVKVKESRVLGGAPAAPAPTHAPSEGENLGSGFVPPTVEEVAEYVRSRSSCVDPQVWVDYYAARGWMTGRAVMKDWKAAVRASETWERWQKPGRRSDVKTPSDYEGGESFV